MTMEEVEEADTGDRCFALEPRERPRCRPARSNECGSCAAHLRARLTSCSLRTRRIREFNDQRGAAVSRICDDEMDVAVVLEFHLDESRPHAKRCRLDTSDALTERRWYRATAQCRNRRLLGCELQLARCAVGQRLHLPALNAAADLTRLRPGSLLRESAGPGEGHEAECEENSRQTASHALLPAPEVPARRAVEPVPAVLAVSDLAELAGPQTLVSPAQCCVDVTSGARLRDGNW